MPTVWPETLDDAEGIPATIHLASHQSAEVLGEVQDGAQNPLPQRLAENAPAVRQHRRALRELR